MKDVLDPTFARSPPEAPGFLLRRPLSSRTQGLTDPPYLGVTSDERGGGTETVSVFI